MTRHAVLGAGGVGAFLGAALARAGRDVLLLMREESLARYGGVVHVESVLLGDFDAELPAAPNLDGSVDVVWVTTKAPHLAAALERVPEAAAQGSVVVPLLNGLDHVELLRRRFGLSRVLPATIVIESERVGPGRVRQLSPSASVRLSPAPQAEDLRDELVDARITASVGDSEGRHPVGEAGTPRADRADNDAARLLPAGRRRGRLGLATPARGVRPRSGGSRT